jgi:hypothetical protein
MNTDKFIYNFSRGLILFSCINTALYNINPNYDILHHIIKDKQSIKFFYILIGLLAIYLLLRERSSYHLAANQNNNSVNSLLDSNSTLLTYNINAIEADQVVWWVTDELNNKIYDNSGISNVDQKGIAKLVIPVNTNKKNMLLRYREVHGGILGDVKTIFLA